VKREREKEGVGGEEGRRKEELISSKKGRSA